MSRAEKAKEYFAQGYACSQAVMLAFSDMVGLDEDTIKKIMLPFGGGVGRLRLTCGAISGIAGVVGMLFAEAENTPENKKKTYAITQALCEKFKDEFGSLLCGELLSGKNLTVQIGGEAEPRTQEYYKKRPCGEMVAHAAKILEDYLAQENSI